MGRIFLGKRFEIEPEIADVNINKLDSPGYSFAMSIPPHLIQLGVIGHPTVDRIFPELAAKYERVNIKVLKNTGDAFIKKVDGVIEAIKSADGFAPYEKDKLIRDIHIMGSVYAIVENPEALVGESVVYSFLNRSEFVVEATLAFEVSFTDCTNPDAKASGFLSIRNISLISCAPIKDRTKEGDLDMQFVKEHHHLPCK